MLPMKVRSDWFISVRVGRLAQTLLKVPNLPQDVSDKELERILWRHCGGPLSEIADFIPLLTELRLVRVDGATIKRTPAGNAISRSIRAGKENMLALALIRAGYFHDQARILLECGEVDETGGLRCATRLARSGAPQLIGVLRAWHEVVILPEVFIPGPLLQELNTVWALLPPAVEIPKWAAERKEVGNRAEMYTVQYERTRVGAKAIFWVSRDSDSLGWDVEDRSLVPVRCIEVKGRRDAEVLFYLSDNEWKKAQKLGSSFEIQFWGEIELTTEPSIEYSNLRARGYPIIISNFASEVGTNWQAVPVSWKITRLNSASTALGQGN